TVQDREPGKRHRPIPRGGSCEHLTSRLDGRLAQGAVALLYRLTTLAHGRSLQRGGRLWRLLRRAACRVGSATVFDVDKVDGEHYSDDEADRKQHDRPGPPARQPAQATPNEHSGDEVARHRPRGVGESTPLV